jgi:hypothetical protein
VSTTLKEGRGGKMPRISFVDARKNISTLMPNHGFFRGTLHTLLMCSEQTPQ